MFQTLSSEVAATEAGRERWRSAARRAGWLLALVSIAWVLRPILSNARDLSGRIAAGPLTLTIALSSVIYGVLSIALMATAWWWLTGVYGTRGRPRRAIAVWARTWVAKYFPGNVGHYVGRQLLAAEIGQRQVVVVAASALEVVGQLAVGAAIVLSGVGGRFRSLRGEPPAGSTLSTGLLLLAIVAAVVAWPLIDFGLRRSPVIRDRLGGLPKLSSVQLVANLGPALVLYAVSFVAFGTVLWALVQAGWLSAASPVGWAEAVWVYTASWAVGFVVVGAPAGLGVREATITLLLTDAMGRSDAATAALAFRFVTLLGDLVTAGIGWWVGRSATGPGDPAGEPR